MPITSLPLPALFLVVFWYTSLPAHPFTKLVQAAYMGTIIAPLVYAARLVIPLTKPEPLMPDEREAFVTARQQIYPPHVNCRWNPHQLHRIPEHLARRHTAYTAHGKIMITPLSADQNEPEQLTKLAVLEHEATHDREYHVPIIYATHCITTLALDQALHAFNRITLPSHPSTAAIKICLNTFRLIQGYLVANTSNDLTRQVRHRLELRADAGVLQSKCDTIITAFAQLLRDRAHQEQAYRQRYGAGQHPHLPLHPCWTTRYESFLHARRRYEKRLHRRAIRTT